VLLCAFPLLFTTHTGFNHLYLCKFTYQSKNEAQTRYIEQRKPETSGLQIFLIFGSKLLSHQSWALYFCIPIFFPEFLFKRNTSIHYDKIKVKKAIIREKDFTIRKKYFPQIFLNSKAQP